MVPPPQFPQLKFAIVRFQVNSDGYISDVVLEKATTSKRHAQSAIRAVKNASPARRFPSDFPEKLKLRFRFDYYDDEHSKDPNVRLKPHLELVNDKGMG